MTILEGSNRVGGRVWTKKFNNGQYGEFGAMRIPGRHDYTRYYIKETNLELGRFITSNPKGFYDVRGTTTPIFEAIDNLYHLYNNLCDNDLALASEIGDNDYPKGVGAILDNLISPLLEGLSQDDKLALYSGQLTDKLKKLDAKALRQFLRQERPESDGAMDLIGSLTSLENLWQGSILEELRGTIEGRGSGLEEIIGGMDKLPKSLAKKEINGKGRVQEDIKFGTEVYGIKTKKNQVEVTYDQNTQKEAKHYNYVLCTIPFSVLRRLELNGLSSEKMLAIRNITYASSTKVLLSCKERFWEGEKYNIIGGASISDRISRQTYYPSNHVQGYHEPWSEQKDGREFQPLSLAAVYSDAFCQREEGASPEEAGVLLGSYTWGMNARRLGVLKPDERAKVVIDSIKNFHPEICEQVCESASMFWDQNKWSAGAFTHFDSSDTDLYYQAGLKPEGRLHFAGEHLSPAPGWIQGAIMSSLRAVLEMVKSFPTGAC
ncbi:MAG: FAD-dependent oxidoreductase [Merismopedia sp. SIO2A8]|nr:FAD-dependent oxidoreductase [Symploca sp. SIO2B6]NET50786.1 FAD-dependent oxidoreductase [Merismopedia sp. SIO2A8]